MYINTEKILQVEHNLLTEILAGADSKNDFLTGYIMGVVELVAELTEERKVDS